MDCFDKTDLREVGRDIKGGKINWMSLTAYDRFSPSQKQIFVKHFGNDTNESVNKIMNLYQDIGMPNIFDEVLKKMLEDFWLKMNDIPNDVIPHKIFSRMSQYIHNRIPA